MTELSVKYTRQFQNHYLVVEKGEKEEGYARRMLEDNRIEGLLKLESGGRYDITSLQSFERLMDHRLLGISDFRRILFSLREVFDRLAEYLLEDEGIVLDPAFIYADPDTLRLQFCYIPGYGADIAGDLSELLSKLLGHIDHKDKEAVVLGYSLYQESLKEGYVLEDLMRQIRNYGWNREVREEKEDPKTDEQTVSEPVERERAGGKEKRFLFPALFKPKEKRNAREDFEGSQESEDWSHYFEEIDHEPEKTEKYEHTVLLRTEGAAEEGSPKACPRLASVDRREKDIELTYFPFIVGKQDRICDHVIEREEVSRMHIKLDRRQDRFYVTDLHSLNGTKVAGEELESEEEREIRRGEEVEIAGIKFVLE